MIKQHVHDVFEEVRLLRGKEAIVNLVNDQLQLWKGLVVFFCLIPARWGWVGDSRAALLV